MTPTARSSKVVLVPDRRPRMGGAGAPPVRRYRLARLRLQSRPTDPPLRYQHLKRVYE